MGISPRLHCPAIAPGTRYTFDNAAHSSTRISDTSGTSPRLRAPDRLPTVAGAFVRVDISATHDDHPAWQTPVETYFVRQPTGWKLVGLMRQPRG
ncbi:MAG: hypothetical protein KA371_22080 [Acidobacteria bacterium]|nr:hypothetical protein [Acidobacteriota bacterium]